MRKELKVVRETPMWLSGMTGNSKHKGSKVRMDLAYLCGCQEARVAGEGGAQGE